MSGDPARAPPPVTKSKAPRNVPIRVAIVEDSREIREGLGFLIGSSPGFACVAACPDGTTALRDLPPCRPDVVLMDIQLPDLSGIECIRRLRTLTPDAQLMMLTVFEDDERIFQSLAAGASGYLVKTTPPAKLLEAIEALHQGGSPMSAAIARRVVDRFRQAVPSPVGAEPSATSLLSPREREVLDHLAQGFLYKEIAPRLGISVETVRTHIRNIYEKLHVRTRTEALLRAFPR
jgi:DNA-binding NarL/FixJ family response regulator